MMIKQIRIHVRVLLFSLTAVSIVTNAGAAPAKPTFTKVEKQRVIVLTDITNEPDDEQSMVRFLCYANEFDVEALIATTSCWLRDRTAPEQIIKRIEAYGRVRPNLIKHASGWPTKRDLLKIVKTGIAKFGMQGVGKGQSSDGAKRIIEVVDADDPRPVYVSIWGGANCLAQALWQVKESRSGMELKRFVSKLRVYTISDQDDSGPWMRKTFPDLFYIVSPGYQENGGNGYHYATWVGISGDKFHGRFKGPDFSIVDNPWLDKNIRRNHGPLGALHPHTKYLMEGDTPSFFWLIPNGLNVPEHPDYGGWGGRYRLYKPETKRWFYGPETRAIWTDAVDKVRGVDGKWYSSNQATIWRWRRAYQNDFAARIDWCIADSFGKANHNPDVVLNGNKSKDVMNLTVTSGTGVTLTAVGTSDPDDDKLTYKWFVYKEAGNFSGNVPLTNTNVPQISFIAPKVKSENTLHVILQVKDNGEPNLFSYRRIVLTIKAKP
jgi:hypothetical protein